MMKVVNVIATALMLITFTASADVVGSPQDTLGAEAFTGLNAGRLGGEGGVQGLGKRLATVWSSFHEGAKNENPPRRLRLRGGFFSELDHDRFPDMMECLGNQADLLKGENERQQRGLVPGRWDINYWETKRWKAKARAKRREKESTKWQERNRYGTTEYVATKEWMEQWKDLQHLVPDEVRETYDAAEEMLDEASRDYAQEGDLVKRDGGEALSEEEGSASEHLGKREGSELPTGPRSKKSRGQDLRDDAKRAASTRAGDVIEAGDGATPSAKASARALWKALYEPCAWDPPSSDDDESTEFSQGVEEEPGAVHVRADLSKQEAVSLGPHMASSLPDALHLTSEQVPARLVLLLLALLPQLQKWCC